MSAICPKCKKKVRVVIPRGGDGSVDVYVRHKDRDGKRCDMSRQEVETK